MNIFAKCDEKRSRKPKELSGMDNSEKQAILGTRHRMKANITTTKTQQRKVKKK